MFAGGRFAVCKSKNFLSAFQSCRHVRSRVRTRLTTTVVSDPDVPLPDVPERKLPHESRVAISIKKPESPKSIETSSDTIRLTKQDVIDKDLFESLCNQCDMEESAAPLALACNKFTRPRLVLTILECALSFCHIERITYEEQSIIFRHVALHAGNQSLLFGEELRAACAYVEGQVRSYNQTQCMRVVWGLVELLGADAHASHLLRAAFNRYRRDAEYLGGEQLMLLAKTLWHFRDSANTVKSMHNTLWNGIMRKLDAASPDEIVETLHVLHDVKALPAVDQELGGRFCRSMRRDIKSIHTDNISRMAALLGKMSLIPAKGEIVVVKLVDEFLSRAPVMSDDEFVLQFCAMLAGCEFLQRQIVASLPQLYRCIGMADSEQATLLASALSSRRLRHSPALSIARSSLGTKLLQNVEEYDARTCCVLLHNVMHMRWKDDFLPLLLAVRAFSACTVLSVEEMCSLVYDYSLIQHPDFGVSEAFCYFVMSSEIGQQLLSWSAGVRLARAMVNLRFNHRDWLQALRQFVTRNRESLLMPKNSSQLASILECFYMLNSPSNQLLKLVLSPAGRAARTSLPLMAQLRLYLSAYSAGIDTDGWHPSIDHLTYTGLADVTPAQRYWMYTAYIAGAGAWQAKPENVQWLRLDQLTAMPDYHFFNEWLGQEFVMQQVDVQGTLPQHTMLLADQSRHLVPWHHLAGWDKVLLSGRVLLSSLMSLCKDQGLQPISVVSVWHDDYLRCHRHLSGLDKTRVQLLRSQGFQTMVVNVSELLDYGPGWYDRLQHVLAENQWSVPKFHSATTTGTNTAADTDTE